MPRPAVGAQEAEDYVYKALGSKVLLVTDPDSPPLPYRTMKICLQLLMKDPGAKIGWNRKVDEARRLGTIGSYRFQFAFKQALFAGYEVAARDPASRIPFLTAYSYFYPNELIENFYVRNKYWYVKELAIEGHAGLVAGDRGNGKTDMAVNLANILIDLKRDHLARGPNSDLSQLRREELRLIRLETSDFEANEDADLLADPTAPTPPAVPENGGSLPIPEPVGGPAPTRGRRPGMGLYRSADIRFPTNITINRNDPLAEYFISCSKMSEFIIAMCHEALRDRFSVIILDEMGFSFNRRRSMTVHNFGIEQLLIVIRKFNAALLAIAQSVEQQLPDSLTSSAQMRVTKLSKTVAAFDIRGMHVAQKVRSIPRATINFATRAFAPFTTDVVPEVMVADIARVEAETTANEEEWTDAKMYRAAIDFCEKTKATEEEIAEGKSGVLRSEIKYLLRQIDPATSKPFTAKQIALELTVDVAKIEETIESIRKDDEKRRKNAAAKALRSTAPASAAEVA